MPDGADLGEPQVGQVIAPASVPAPSIDVAARASKREKETLTDRFNAKVDLHITELKADKDRLRVELQVIRQTEIPHLREDVRWLEGRQTSLVTAFTAVKSSYDWAIAFNWFSFALVVVGGGFVSYASFLAAPQSPAEMDKRTVVATIAVVALVLGVLVQGIVSYRGTMTLKSLPEVEPKLERPSPNAPTSP